MVFIEMIWRTLIHSVKKKSKVLVWILPFVLIVTGFVLKTAFDKLSDLAKRNDDEGLG